MSTPIAALLDFRRTHAVVLLVGLCLLWLGVVAEPGAAQSTREDKALGRPATASSVETQRFGSCGERNANPVCTPDKANDGDANTRWASAFSDNQYWQVDLGSARLVDTILADWQFEYPRRYQLSTSLDGSNFSDIDGGSVQFNANGDHYGVEIRFSARSARFVRVSGITRAIRGGKKYGFSLWSVNVFGPQDGPGAPVVPASGPLVPEPSLPVSPQEAPQPSPPAGPTSPTRTERNSSRSPRLRLIAPSTRVRLSGTVVGSRVNIRLLSVRAPRTATVRVVCKGSGCPSRVRSRRGTGVIRELRRVLRSGAALEVFITQRGTYGKYTRFQIRRDAPPKRTDRCVAYGRRTPRACPAS